MVLSFAIVVAFAAAGLALQRSQRHHVDRSWLKLAPAVPDLRADAHGAYRGSAASTGALHGASDPSALAPVEAASRKVLDLGAESLEVKRRLGLIAAAAPGVSALLFALAPPVGLGAAAAGVGGVLGLGGGAAILRDDRRAIGVLLALTFPLAIASLPVGIGCLALFGTMRLLLDMKDSAASRESDRERAADPRFLAGSLERRAGGAAIGRRSGGGDVTAATARDNSKA